MDRRFGTIVFGLVCALCLPACTGAKISTGACTPDCPGGTICLKGQCIHVCNADLDCTTGLICTEGMCVTGTRGTPTLTGFDGDGTAVCPDAGGTHCIATGMLVTGTNLEGARFSLRPATGTDIPLTVTSQTEAGAVLSLPSTIPPAGYTLVAVNQAGNAQQVLTLLQGPKGDPGQDGQPGLSFTLPYSSGSYSNAASPAMSLQNAATGGVALQVTQGAVDFSSAGVKLPFVTVVNTDVQPVVWDGNARFSYAACPAGYKPISGGCSVFQTNACGGWLETPSNAPQGLIGCPAADMLPTSPCSGADEFLCLRQATDTIGTLTNNGEGCGAMQIVSLGWRCASPVALGPGACGGTPAIRTYVLCMAAPGY